jgi:uncharacterized Tic20 family protein
MSDSPFTGKPPASGNSDERLWGMLCHLSSLSGGVIPFGNIVGPLIVWLVKKDEYAFVDDQGKESLNFQISMMIYTIVLALTIIGIPVAIAAMIFGLVMTVIAAIKANGGEYYRYPLTIRFVK